MVRSGTVWIDLSKEHYGIHGTPEPSKIGHTASHGCPAYELGCAAIGPLGAPGNDRHLPMRRFERRRVERRRRVFITVGLSFALGALTNEALTWQRPRESADGPTATSAADTEPAHEPIEPVAVERPATTSSCQRPSSNASRRICHRHAAAPRSGISGRRRRSQRASRYIRRYTWTRPLARSARHHGAARNACSRRGGRNNYEAVRQPPAVAA